MSFWPKKTLIVSSIMQSQRRTVLKVRQRGEVEQTEGGKIQRRRRRRSEIGEMKGIARKERAVVRRRRGEQKGCGGDEMK